MFVLRRVLWALFLIVLFWHLWLLAQVLWFKWFNPSETSFMEIRREEIQQKKPEATVLRDERPRSRARIAGIPISA